MQFTMSVVGIEMGMGMGMGMGFGVFAHCVGWIGKVMGMVLMDTNCGAVNEVLFGEVGVGAMVNRV